MNNALLSRCRVFVLEKLTPDAIYRVLVRALSIAQTPKTPTLDSDTPSTTSPAVSTLEGPIDEPLLRFLAAAADGDARVALSSLELAITATSDPSSTFTAEELKAQLRKAHLQYDRSGGASSPRPNTAAVATLTHNHSFRPPLRHDLGAPQVRSRRGRERGAVLARPNVAGRRRPALRRAPLDPNGALPSIYLDTLR